MVNYHWVENSIKKKKVVDAYSGMILSPESIWQNDFSYLQGLESIEYYVCVLALGRLSKEWFPEIYIIF